jgi:2'-5' RNA ligase
MRIFIALDIPEKIREHMAEYMERMRRHAPEARWARVEGLHVTLKFVGEVKDDKLVRIKEELKKVKATPFPVSFEQVGFFPTSKSPRVFWIGVDGGQALAQLAADIESRLERFGVDKDARSFNPHLTLSRAGSGPGANQNLKRIAEVVSREAVPQFGTMTAHAFFLYRSELGRGGSKYTKL